MRTILCITAVIATTVSWSSSDRTAAARCSYFAAYPEAIGPHTFLIATATRDAVTAMLDSTKSFRPRAVPAQLMRIDDVAGFQEEAIRAGLATSGGRAVFVRHLIGPSCAPFPAPDGAFDSVDIGGLYVGRPRPASQWVDGIPTFDILRAQHNPLPQRLSGPSGHAVFTSVDSTPTMTADELFVMYRALWAKSVAPNDRSPEQRITQWLAAHPMAARKQPAQQVASDMLFAATNATVAANAVPLGGTFAISVVVPGVDSLVMYGQTTSRTRLWRVDVARDSLSRVPIAVLPHSFAVDVVTASTPHGLAAPDGRINPCSPVVIIVNALPVPVEVDSSWRGEISLSGFLNCAPQGSALHALTRAIEQQVDAVGPAPVRFRRRADGRVTFEARATRDGKTRISVRGERISQQQHRPLQ